MAQDIEDQLQFHVENYQTFMENQYYGKIINFSEADDHSSAQYKCKPYPQSTDSLQKHLIFNIKFQSANSGYDVSLTSYYE